MTFPETDAERLEAIRNKLKTIVEYEGDDAGVILLSSESPTTFDKFLQVQVYKHPYFSELGGALVELCILVGLRH